MSEQRLPVRDKETKAIRDQLKRLGFKLVKYTRYAVVREDDGPELCGGTLDDVFLWIARQVREGKL